MLLKFSRLLLSDIEYAIMQEDCLQQAILEVLPFERGFFSYSETEYIKKPVIS